MVAVTLGLSLGGGAALKGECVGGSRFWRSELCYADIKPLYRDRGLGRHVFPYVHATLAGGHGGHGFNEYPVLTGLFMWLTSWLSWSASSYLAVTIVLLAVCAAGIAHLVWRMAGLRAWCWSASPVLVMYAFHNWDMLAVSASVLGLYLWWSGRPRAAALALGVGAAFKLYPALFIVPVVCDELAHRRMRGAAQTAVAGLATLAIINLPFVLINARGWWATYRFHADRAPSAGTIWAAAHPDLSTGAENLVMAVLLATSLLALTGALVRRRTPGYPVVEWCAAATAIVIVVNKIDSPQYLLWLIPFLALMRGQAMWWLVLSATAVVRYLALFGVGIVPIGTSSADHIANAAGWVEAVVLILFAVTVVLRTTGRAPASAPAPA